MSYTKQDIEQLERLYRDQLLNDTLPFWFPRSYDTEHGGFLLMRDRDGSLIDDDKAVWIQGRATWLLATLYNTVEKRQEWLDGAKLGYEFLMNHCFDTDGQMFFHVTRDGSPIRKRRYFFSETFAVIALAAYAKATGSEEIAEQARRIFSKCIEYATIPGLLPPK
ncbi:MAG TPA: AGE family epimerase/isomerase, partial [Mucilaginibacter sp.]|nr:AGE family epimerase/isomerase [Mucilaginibacter sp.]